MPNVIKFYYSECPSNFFIVYFVVNKPNYDISLYLLI